MTGLTYLEGVRDELLECCTKQLNTRMVQMHGLGSLGSCNEDQLLGFIKAIAMRGVHKEVHRDEFHPYSLVEHDCPKCGTAAAPMQSLRSTQLS